MTSHQSHSDLNAWPVQDAKAHFSELLNTCLKEGPQLVTRRGLEIAILVPFKEWQQLSDSRRPTLKELLLNPPSRGDLNIPKRGNIKSRKIPIL